MTATHQTSTAVVPADRGSAPTADPESYCDVRSHTEALAAPLSPEDQVVQSMTDASPTKWHRAHTTWFFEEFVLSRTDSHELFDESFRFLFNSYYEAVGDRQPRPRRGMVTRPDVATVARYRKHVDRSMLEALRDGLLDDTALALAELGLHHEQQHQELLLMDILHLFAQNVAAPAYADDTTTVTPHPPVAVGPGGGDSTHSFEGGVVEIGHEGSGFAFDNESPRHRVHLEPFALEHRLVTCGEWLEFMADGGYDRHELWLSDGWHHSREHRWGAPAYWRRHPDDARRWQRFGLDGLTAVSPDEPVSHVSYYEADAFARWRGGRLPTEAEWEVAARSAHTCEGGGPSQMHGALWQWTSSAYSSYPGFSPAPGAVGEYNGKFMVNQQVLRGSSFATPPGHARDTYRNFFGPASRWVFAGLRVAHDHT